MHAPDPRPGRFPLRPGGEPRVSVVVIAHDRKQFVGAAVESVLRQHADPVAFEIIVVTNFLDDRLDRSFSATGVRMIETPQSPIGEKIMAGVEHARGQVVAFLEDDDLWRPGKLGAVHAAWEQDPDLTLYHNAFDKFRDSGGGPPPGLLEAQVRVGGRAERPIPLGALPRSAARRILAEGRLANLSSLVIRRDIAEENADFVRDTRLAPEPALFAAACHENGTFASDPRAWTLLRQHDASVTSVPAGPGAEQLRSVRSLVERALPDLLRAENHVRARTPRRILRFLRLTAQLQQILAADGSSRVRGLKIAIEHLRSLDLIAVPGSWMVDDLGLTARYLVSPKWAKRQFLERIRKATASASQQGGR